MKLIKFLLLNYETGRKVLHESMFFFLISRVKGKGPTNNVQSKARTEHLKCSFYAILKYTNKSKNRPLFVTRTGVALQKSNLGRSTEVK